MALSPKDRRYYEEKLNWKSFRYVAGATVVIGTIGFPLMFFVQDWSNGLEGMWTFRVALSWIAMGFMIGCIVASVMYMLFSFLLEMGWLPAQK